MLFDTEKPGRDRGNRYRYQKARRSGAHCWTGVLKRAGGFFNNSKIYDFSACPERTLPYDSSDLKYNFGTNIPIRNRLATSLGTRDGPHLLVRLEDIRNWSG